MNPSNDILTKPEAFKYNIQVLERALNIFEIISQSKSPMTIQDLQNATGLNRTTIWRILSTMIESGFLTQLPHTKQYCISCKACNLLSVSSASSVALVEYARPEMEQLRRLSGETIMLLLPEMIGSRTILQLDSFENIRLKDYTNIITPLFGTSTGLVQLSFMNDEEIETIFPDKLPSYTEFTPTNRADIMQRIEDCRRDGYAYIIDEYNQGDSGLSVPISLDKKLVGILNIAGPTVRFTKTHMLSYIPKLKSSAAHIAQNLSH